MHNPFLVGERIYLRPLDTDDLERCLRWINDPGITSTLTMRFPMSRSQEESWLLSHYKDQSNLSLAIVIKNDDQHIGNCGLHSIDYVNRNAEFGIMLGESDQWGKGYAPEAGQLIVNYGFKQLAMHRIYLNVYSHNNRAKRAYEKLGFVHEGIMRESYFRDGRYYDSLIMAILESEWDT
jgi:[ribosomal protein S5]-alanine N-acetyltransferase